MNVVIWDFTVVCYWVTCYFGTVQRSIYWSKNHISLPHHTGNLFPSPCDMPNFPPHRPILDLFLPLSHLFFPFNFNSPLFFCLFSLFRHTFLFFLLISPTLRWGISSNIYTSGTLRYRITRNFFLLGNFEITKFVTSSI
jgi:hypothetical protein